MRVAILPSGALLADTAPVNDEASDGLSATARARVARAFGRGPGHALLDLGATELDAPLVPPLAFLRDLGRAFVTRLCAMPDLEERRERIEVDCPTDERARLAGAVPPMDGGEYVDADWVAARWADLNRAFADEIRAHRGPVYADLANRLPRGRAYLRNGSVLHLAIAGGRVEAYVAGSDLYRVTIAIASMARARWRRVVARCTGRIGSLVGLLRGELSDDVLAVLTDAKDGLFPEPREMTLDCSCPDSAEVCKHVAAVLYGVGIRLDARPELFFVLRQVDQAELLSSATAGAVSRARPAAGKRIADDRLSAVFGIELEDAPPVRAGRPPRRGKPRPSRVSGRRR